MAAPLRVSHNTDPKNICCPKTIEERRIDTRG